MIITNFICPCCGLPNNLEFKTEEDYQSYLTEPVTEDLWQGGNSQFSWYTLNEAETEEGRRAEIQKRFNSIKKISNKNGTDFKNWFRTEVVGFIPEGESNGD